jgi:ketosteroid isomerase-like protein
MQNSKIVQEMYAAFGRGDVPAILQRLADDVEWEYGVNSTDVPCCSHVEAAPKWQNFRSAWRVRFSQICPQNISSRVAILLSFF